MLEEGAPGMEKIDHSTDLTFHQLTLFRTVARYLSYTRAAEHLYLSQPAVSQQIKALEKQLGLALFVRQGRGIALTPAGRELQCHAEQLLALFAEMATLVHDVHHVRRGGVTIGASTSAGTYLVPPLLGAFHARYPGIQITLTVANRRSIEQALLTHQVDLAVISIIAHRERFVIEHLAPYELVIIAAPTHPLARATALTLNDLREETVLLRERGAGTRYDAELHFAQKAIKLHSRLEFDNIEVIKEGVMAGLGIAVLSRESVAQEVEHGDLVILPVEGFPLLRHWYIVHLKERRLSLAAAALRAFLLQTRIL
jgi:DNA-binding transcriptional LysR family regulator